MSLKGDFVSVGERFKQSTIDLAKASESYKLARLEEIQKVMALDEEVVDRIKKALLYNRVSYERSSRRMSYPSVDTYFIVRDGRSDERLEQITKALIPLDLLIEFRLNPPNDEIYYSVEVAILCILTTLTTLGLNPITLEELKINFDRIVAKYDFNSRTVETMRTIITLV